ncbi:MAG: UDP-N-acetylmuramate dehydrogenase [Leptospirales bacterium]
MIIPGELLSRHSPIRIGGPAQYLALPDSIDSLLEVLEAISSGRLPGPVRYIGNASNLLFPDAGMAGTVISLKKMSGFRILDGGVVEAEAGAFLPRLAFHAARKGLDGFGFLSGIPGTVGGGVVMNAGTRISEMSEVLLEVRVIDRSGCLRSLSKNDLSFGYRSSSFQGEHSSLGEALHEQYVIVGATFAGFEGDSSRLMDEWVTLRSERSLTQPLSTPSLGSVFRNPSGHFSGRLIEQAGWKGKTSGGIQVSPLHANFFVNTGDGLSRDFRGLMDSVRDSVFLASGVLLEAEVELLPDLSPASV